MAIRTKEELKALFETGDKPTQQDFTDLIDTLSADDASLLVAETVVTGSAVTSVSFSGLDGNAHGGYVLIVTAKNATADHSGLRLTLNNDTTQTNYNHRVIYKTTANDIAALATGLDNAICPYGAGDLSASSDNAAVVDIIPSVDATYTFSRDSYSNCAIEIVHQKYKSGTNITSIEITASVASSIAVGSTFRLYKRK